MAIGKTAAPAQPAAVRKSTLIPSLMDVGGGLVDDVNVRVSDIAFTLWDYNGSAPESLALAVEIERTDGEHLNADGTPYVQYYSAGDKKYFVPSEPDGAFAVPVGDKENLNQNTNAAKLLDSIITAGFPTEKIIEANESVKVFIGTEMHMKRVAQEERKGLIQTPRPGQKQQYAKTILLCDGILKFPWEAASTPAKGIGKVTAPKATAAKATAAPAPVAAAPVATEVSQTGGGEPNFDPETVEGKLTNFLLEKVTDAGEAGVAKATLTNLIFQNFKADTDRNKLAQLVQSAAFISAEYQPWAFDGKTLKARA